MHTITEHILYAVTDDGVKHRISEPEGWDAAIARWYRFDDRRFKEGQPASIDGSLVRFYALRSEDDPEWPADAPLAQVIEHTIEPNHLRTKGGQPLKAVRDWAEAEGYQGRDGGWIHDEKGEPVAQGWANLIHMNFEGLLRNRKVQAAALTHHFGIGRRPKPLPKRQAETLLVLFRHGAGERTIKPANMQRATVNYNRGAWDGPHPTDLVAPATALEKKGLLTISGVPYGPKSYRLTAEGVRVAKTLTQEN